MSVSPAENMRAVIDILIQDMLEKGILDKATNEKMDLMKLDQSIDELADIVPMASLNDADTQKKLEFAILLHALDLKKKRPDHDTGIVIASMFSASRFDDLRLEDRATVKQAIKDTLSTYKPEFSDAKLDLLAEVAMKKMEDPNYNFKDELTKIIDAKGIGKDQNLSQEELKEITQELGITCEDPQVIAEYVQAIVQSRDTELKGEVNNKMVEETTEQNEEILEEGAEEEADKEYEETFEGIDREEKIEEEVEEADEKEGKEYDEEHKPNNAEKPAQSNDSESTNPMFAIANQNEESLQTVQNDMHAENIQTSNPSTAPKPPVQMNNTGTE